MESLILPIDLLPSSVRLSSKKPIRAGIYMIYCSGNGMAYIGSSMGLYQRLTKHGVLLRDNAHKTPHLQNAWNRYGEDAFSFRVIEFCDGEQTSQSLLDRENFHLLDPSRHAFQCVCACDPWWYTVWNEDE